MRGGVEVRQIRAARGLLDWTQRRLAEEAGLSIPTIKRLERDVSGAGAASFRAVVAALEAAGIVFLDQERLGPDLHVGVALKADEPRGR